MVQLTFWTVLTLCLSIYRAANGGEDAKHAWTKTMSFSCPIVNVLSQCKTSCERICIEFTALCLKKDNSPYIGSVSYVCKTTDPVSNSDEKHSCDMICTKSGLSVPCLNISFDDHCDTSTINECHGEAESNSEIKLSPIVCGNCLAVICNVSTTRATTTTQSTVNSSDSSTSRMTEMNSKSTIVMNSTTTSSNSMTSTKGTEPATAFSPELSTEGTSTYASIDGDNDDDEKKKKNGKEEEEEEEEEEEKEKEPTTKSILKPPNGSNLMTQSNSLTGVVVVSVIGVLVTLIIAVLLIVIFCRRYRGGRVSFDDRLRGVDIIEATNGQRNPAYSLVQGISTADDSSHHPQSMNIYSEPSTQNPSTTNNDDEDDRILVDNDLYRC